MVSSRYTEDSAGMSATCQAPVGDSPVKVPEYLLPIAPGGRRTIKQDHRDPISSDREAADPITSAFATVVGVLLSDGTSFGQSASLERMKRERSARATKLGEYVSALRAADGAGARKEVLLSLRQESIKRPQVSDWLEQVGAQLEAMPGDVHTMPRDLIGVMEEQHKAVVRGH